MNQFKIKTGFKKIDMECIVKLLDLNYDLKYCEDLAKYIIKAYKKYLKDEKKQ